MFSLQKNRGWTLLELLAALAVCGVLASVGYGSYASAVQRARVASAMADISVIHGALERYRIFNNEALPNNLAEIGYALTDPWGTPYEYLNFGTVPGKSKGSVRKDHNLVPLNSRYDLYSKGPDRDTSAPLTAKLGRDDIIMANDGAFIGPAEDY